MRRTVSKSFEFCYGHHLRFHAGKCKNLHGHNAKVIVTLAEHQPISAPAMVMDFGVLKMRVNKWLDENWDHAMVVAKEDTPLREMLAGIPDQKIYVMDGEPTAENMATVLLNILPMLFKNQGVFVSQVDFYETPDSLASVFVE